MYLYIQLSSSLFEATIEPASAASALQIANTHYIYIFFQQDSESTFLCYTLDFWSSVPLSKDTEPHDHSVQHPHHFIKFYQISPHPFTSKKTFLSCFYVIIVAHTRVTILQNLFWTSSGHSCSPKKK